MQIDVVTGDITTCAVDAVVTAADRSLVGGGGVDGAVHRAAGPRLLAAVHPLAPCPPGDAVVTEGFDLVPSVRWVVHAVGPRYGVDEPADELLADAYRAALARCDEVGAASVAFPSLSTGRYHFPLRAACRISARALMCAATQVRSCLPVAFDEKTARAWTAALRRVTAAGPPPDRT